MKLILNQDVANLGEEGDVVVVKDGYGRNYLLPNKIAVPYTQGNLAQVKNRAEAIEARKQAKRAASATMKEKLDAMTLVITVSAGERGKLFGSVTSQMVQDAIAKQGVEVERKRLEVPTKAIRMTGEYEVRVRLYEDEFSLVKLMVQSEAEKKAAEKAAAEEAAKAAAEEAEKAAAEAEEAAEEEVVEEAEEVVEAAEEAEKVEE